MQDGIYRVIYAGVAGAALGVFVVRNGEFFGIGTSGGEYSGTSRFEPTRNQIVFEGEGRIPPNTDLLFGLMTSGEHGLVGKLKGEFARPNPTTRFSLEFAGRPIDVAMTYVSPLPGGGA